jgi:hypothetical protein
VPSLVHDGLLDVFRQRPDLAFRLARGVGLPVRARHDGYRPLANAFVDPARPNVRFEADLILAGYVRLPSGVELVESLDVEAQLGVDPAKYVALPIYRAGMHSQTHQPGWTLMISPVHRVLTWAECRLFPREPELRPALVGPDQVVPPLDRVEALEDPDWAVLRAVLHARTRHACLAAEVALDVIDSLPEPKRSCYRLLIEATRRRTEMDEIIRMPDVDDDISEFEMEGYVYQTGLARGEARGEARGREQGLREALLDLLHALGIRLDDEASERIATCHDPSLLRTWLSRAPRVRDLHELFARAEVPS